MSNTSKTTKKIRRTKSINPSIPEATETSKIERIPEYPKPSRKVNEVFSVLEGFGKIDIIRLCGVGIQDLGIIDPIDGWANGVDDLYNRCSKVLFDEHGKVRKKWIQPCLSLEKNHATSTPPTMLSSLCMMVGVTVFVDHE